MKKNSKRPNASPYSGNRVLVIGTSTDYIDFIYRQHPDRALFVTDPAERRRGEEPAPEKQSELLVEMDNPAAVLEKLCHHLKRYGLKATGVACFDCESLHLSSLLAEKLAFPFPSPESILTSRSKYLSKSRWQEAGLDCPSALQTGSPEEAFAFAVRHGGRIVLKPLTGSGSELVFICTTAEEIASCFAVIRNRMAAMPKEGMYAAYESDGLLIDPRQLFIVEEHCEGSEYSADFFIDGDRVEIIRITRKQMKSDPAPGTVLAYELPSKLPIDLVCLQEILYRAAISIGIEHGLCMIDFIMDGNRMVILELTPRPGGDCLPQLLQAACGMDILGLALDVAEGLPVHLPKPEQFRHLVALRLFAPLPGGTVSEIDAVNIERDPRVLEVKLERKPGYRVIHPPESYHSRVMGYVLFRPFSDDTIEQECYELLDKLIIKYSKEESA